MLTTLNLCNIIECGDNCNSCSGTGVGAGKCDSNGCKTGYVYESGTKTCAGMYMNKFGL